MIDTLKIAKRLEAAHLSVEQAEAIATSIAEVASGELATKADLQGLEARLSDKIVGVRVDLIDRIEIVNEILNSACDRITWVIIGVSGLNLVAPIVRHNP